MNEVQMLKEALDEAGFPEARPNPSTRGSTQTRMITWLAVLCRLALAGVFIYAGVTKIVSPQQFGDSIATFKLLPPPAIALVMFGLPPLEVILGGMLIFGIRTRAAAFGVTILSLVFLGAIGQSLVRGLQIDCGCFGSGAPSTVGAWITFGRDVVILAAAMFVHYRESQSLGRP